MEPSYQTRENDRNKQQKDKAHVEEIVELKKQLEHANNMVVMLSSMLGLLNCAIFCRL